MTAVSIAHLRIKLDDVEPAVVRRVEVPLTIRLDRLHLVLQAAMGWTNSHLYEIRARDVGWGSPDPDFGDGPLDASKARLIDVLEDVGAKSLKYLYDFGDGWEHSVRIERITDAVPGIVYPRLIDAAGRCPPEDVGGPWGYREFLDAIADPNHQEHAERLQWIGRNFDPNDVDAEALAQAVHASPRSRPADHQPANAADPRSSPCGYDLRMHAALQ
jgi:Plasmid pRiA4b ORF-3-like protein